MQAKACNFCKKKRLWNMCFPVNFRKFLRIPFLTEHLWWLPLHQFEIEKIGTGRFQIILWNFAVFVKSYRSSPPYVFLGKKVLKICSKFTGGPPCRSVISIKLFCKFTETTLRHGYFPLNLLHVFRVKIKAIWINFYSFVKGFFFFLPYYSHIIFLFSIFIMV